ALHEAGLDIERVRASLDRRNMDERAVRIPAREVRGIDELEVEVAALVDVPPIGGHGFVAIVSVGLDMLRCGCWLCLLGESRLGWRRRRRDSRYSASRVLPAPRIRVHEHSGRDRSQHGDAGQAEPSDSKTLR